MSKDMFRNKAQAVVVGNGGSFVEKFYPQDDKILNPFDERPSVLSKEQRGVDDAENKAIAVNGRPEDLEKFIEGLTRKIRSGVKLEGTASILDFFAPEVKAEIIAKEGNEL